MSAPDPVLVLDIGSRSTTADLCGEGDQRERIFAVLHHGGERKPGDEGVPGVREELSSRRGTPSVVIHPVEPGGGGSPVEDLIGPQARRLPRWAAAVAALHDRGSVPVRGRVLVCDTAADPVELTVVEPGANGTPTARTRVAGVSVRAFCESVVDEVCAALADVEPDLAGRLAAPGSDPDRRYRSRLVESVRSWCARTGASTGLEVEVPVLGTPVELTAGTIRKAARRSFAPAGDALARLLDPDAAPFDAAPFDAAPFDTAPFDTAPFDAAPSDAAPSDAAPSGTTTSDALAAVAVVDGIGALLVASLDPSLPPATLVDPVDGAVALVRGAVPGAPAVRFPSRTRWSPGRSAGWRLVLPASAVVVALLLFIGVVPRSPLPEPPRRLGCSPVEEVVLRQTGARTDEVPWSLSVEVCLFRGGDGHYASISMSSPVIRVKSGYVTWRVELRTCETPSRALSGRGYPDQAWVRFGDITESLPVDQGTSPVAAAGRYRATGRVAAVFVVDSRNQDAGEWFGTSARLLESGCFGS